MRVLFLSTIYPNPAEPDKGAFNRNLVHGLARGHEVVVLAPVPWTADPPWRRTRTGGTIPACRQRDENGVVIHHPRFYYPPRALLSRRHLFYWWSVREQIGGLIRDFRPDVVLGYWVHPDGAVAVRAARLAGARAGVIVGGSDVLLLPHSARRRRHVMRVLDSADVVACVSEHLRRRVVGLGAPHHRAHVWRQGVDTTLFRPADRAEARHRLGVSETSPVLLWVGRMVPVKGLDVLLEACRRLRNRGVAFDLILAGDGPLRPSLEGTVRAGGMAGCVRFVGACAQDRLPDLYRAADVTVLPSHSEGLPNVLRESVCCGTPFVASDVGGVSEIAERPPDRLVPPGDPERLAAALIDSLGDRGSRPPRTARARSWDESADHLIELLRAGTSQ
ncbi:glycosyltransferase [bacterium]|nr:glycosyltransferase [bacterium]